MIDLSVIAAGGPILLGVAAGIIGRRTLRRLDERHVRRQLQPARSPR